MFIGNQRSVGYLEKVIRRGTLAHGYFFYGPEHVGKRMVADAAAKGFFCEKNEKKLFGCGECRLCLAFDNGAAPGHVVLKAGEPIVAAIEKGKKEIAIDEVREVRRRLGISGRHTVIVDGAEGLSDAAANAFLKILEEPRGDVFFIFVSHSMPQVLSTVISRLVPLPFDYVPEIQLTQASEGDTALVQIAAGAPGILIRAMKDADFKAKLLSIYKEAEGAHRGTLASTMASSERFSDQDEFRDYFIRYLFHLKRASISIAEDRALRNARRLNRALEALHLYETTNVNKRLFLDIICMNLRAL